MVRWEQEACVCSTSLSQFEDSLNMGAPVMAAEGKVSSSGVREDLERSVNAQWWTPGTMAPRKKPWHCSMWVVACSTCWGVHP